VSKQIWGVGTDQYDPNHVYSVDNNEYVDVMFYRIGARGTQKAHFEMQKKHTGAG
jgi:hypothetical protein